MKIAIGSDHRGFEAKERIKALLQNLGAPVVDHGTFSRDAFDYPDSALAVATDVAEGRAERGILFCGTGLGMSIAANKVSGVRAALCHDELTAQLSRRHNNANVLCLPADLVGDALMQSMVKTWIETEFEGGRHARRVGKIVDYEKDHNLNGQADVEEDEASEAESAGRLKAGKRRAKKR
ncbi:MAG: ribose 5-phosphate isomerase B [Phycisphaerae bacterium]